MKKERKITRTIGLAVCEISFYCKGTKTVETMRQEFPYHGESDKEILEMATTENFIAVDMVDKTIYNVLYAVTESVFIQQGEIVKCEKVEQ